MAKTPRGERLVITILGCRNAGKSSLLNALTGQEIAIVSGYAGTTTDPVAKAYELLPLGPVTMYDTAGIDDTGELGEKRIKATYKTLLKTDIALMVIHKPSAEDFALLDKITSLKIPALVVFNKSDLNDVAEDELSKIKAYRLPWLKASALTGEGIREIKEMLITLSNKDLTAEQTLLAGMVQPGNVVLLITPIDLAAPKGRLILPQVEVLREILDNDAIGMIVKEREIEEAFNRLPKLPDLVITDSQVVLKVAGDVPESVPFTTFSMLFARYKGELEILYKGAKTIDSLQNGDKVLIAEACSHHVQADDIGRVKIPRWLLQYTGKNIDFDVFSGHDFPDNLETYKLVIHCGACMLNRMEMTRRLREAELRNVSVTNYGIAISKLQGVLERTMKPFFQS